MAGMQRFVTYIYAYENGQKSSNAGYAKIETRGNAGRMEIHFTGSGISGGMGKVSFLYVEEGRLHAIPVGELRVENGRAMEQYTFRTMMMLDTELSFDGMVGLEIVDINEQRYRSFWRDIENINFSEPRGNAGVEKDELPVQKQQEDLQERSQEQIPKEILEDAEQESLHTMEIPMRNVFPNYTMEDIWRNMEKNRTCVQINEEVCALQIELNDLRELPKKHWYLGNNSFLLHGFFNYHYLLWGRLPNGRWFLGVPGAFERQERVIASVFGFPGFMQATASEAQGELKAAETEPQELQQGFWYHILED